MSFTPALILPLLGIGSALSLAACSADEGPTSVDGDGTGGASARKCDTNYTDLTTDPVSFKDDVMPMLGLSCQGSECHSNDKPKAELYLGVRCKYDAAAKWLCTFPSAPEGPDIAGDPQPLTQGIQDEVHKQLLLPSKTVPSVARVTPYEPSNSFLLDKLANIQNEQSYAAECTNQDTSRSKSPCGGSMPVTGTTFCLSTKRRPDSTVDTAYGQRKFDTIAAWIQQGAPNN